MCNCNCNSKLFYPAVENVKRCRTVAPLTTAPLVTRLDIAPTIGLKNLVSEKKIKSQYRL